LLAAFALSVSQIPSWSAKARMLLLATADWLRLENWD
jgi:hypothetical protein